MSVLDSKIPAGPIAEKWDKYKQDVKLVNPNNKRKFKIIVVGTGLAGASAAATLAELGYQVDAFTFHDSPRPGPLDRRQGGINAAKNYHGDGDSVHRLFYDTVKGGDFRPASPTCTASPRSASTSSTRWSPRACRSPASTAACSTTAASAARRSAARSTPARPASSCCSAPTSRWRARSGSATSGCSTASSSSTS